MVWSPNSAASASGHFTGPSQNRVVPFPRRYEQAPQKQIEITDPDITVLTEDGRSLEKLGMSGDECCYILLPDVHQVTFRYRSAPSEVVASVRDVASALFDKIIVSEVDAVSEIGMLCAGSSDPYRDGDMRWVEPGRTLFLARKSPDHVALLSVKLANR